MSESLKKFRKELKDAILGVIWSAWSQLGVMGESDSDPQLVDPEALLLLTLECAREDPRIFDEVLDWLTKNGEWINVTRLTSLLRKDRLCDPSVVGAVAALLTEHDSSTKWRSIAKRFIPTTLSATPLFLRSGRPLDASPSEPDSRFSTYGWLRSPLQLRGMSQSPDLNSPAAFMLQCRAFFGVNIRADVWAHLMLNGRGTASRIARELGYTQPRVHEAMRGMHGAGAFGVRQDGNRKEYHVILGRGWPVFGEEPEKVRCWRDWRSYGRCAVAVWHHAYAMKESGATGYIVDAEISSATDRVRSDFNSAGIPLSKNPNSDEVLALLKAF